MSAEVLSCPFCGCAGEIVNIDGAWIAGCSAGQHRPGDDMTCRANAIGFYHRTREGAIAAWNRRASTEGASAPATPLGAEPYPADFAEQDATTIDELVKATLDGRIYGQTRDRLAATLTGVAQRLRAFASAQRDAAPESPIENQGAVDGGRDGAGPITYAEPVRLLGAKLTELLDEHHWAEIEPMLHDVGELVEQLRPQDAKQAAVGGLSGEEVSPPTDADLHRLVTEMYNATSERERINQHNDKHSMHVQQEAYDRMQRAGDAVLDMLKTLRRAALSGRRAGTGATHDSQLVAEFKVFVESGETSHTRRPLLNRVLNALDFAASRAASSVPSDTPDDADPLNVECGYCLAKQRASCTMRKRDGGTEPCAPHMTRIDRARYEAHGRAQRSGQRPSSEEVK